MVVEAIIASVIKFIFMGAPFTTQEFKTVEFIVEIKEEGGIEGDMTGLFACVFKTCNVSIGS